MRFSAIILFCLLITAPSSVQSADSNQIFSTIIGEIGRQIERQQHKKQLRRLRPLWDACAKGDVAACDRAAKFPNLTDEARDAIARMRYHAEHWPAFERNFQACQKWDRMACQAALDYPYVDDTDRTKLKSWKQIADQRHDALIAFRQHQRECNAGAIAACDAALRERHLDEGAVPDLERQRDVLRMIQEREAREQQRRDGLAHFRAYERSCHAGSVAACNNAIDASVVDEIAIPGIKAQRDKLQLADQERQAREQRRMALLARFRQHQRNCDAGSISACDAAINLGQIDERAIPSLERQRANLQSLERQRRDEQQQRETAIREYDSLRAGCLEGERASCKAAIIHPHVRSSDLALLKRRDRELEPITERIANVYANAKFSTGIGDRANGVVGSALLGVITLLGLGLGTFIFMRSRRPTLLARVEPPGLAVASADPSTEKETSFTFPLSGHMPTDIRYAIVLANQ